MTKRTILLTGATDGLGKMLAEELAHQAFKLLLHGRDAAKLAQLQQNLQQAHPQLEVATYRADFSSFQEVRAMAAELLERESRLDLLLNNAGMGAGTSHAPRQLNADGHELRLVVNYLSPFLLTQLLLPLLQKTAQQAEDVRIVQVASIGQRRLDFSDLMLERNYSGIHAYSQSKLAMIMSGFELAAALKHDGITVNSLHPASLMPTKMTLEAFGYGMASIQEGVAATKHVLLSETLRGQTGLYLEGQTPARANAQAYDSAARRQLYQLSLDLVGLVPSA